jgi:glycolate oxidase iron-sulfur subunit
MLPFPARLRLLSLPLLLVHLFRRSPGMPWTDAPAAPQAHRSDEAAVGLAGATAEIERPHGALSPRHGLWNTMRSLLALAPPIRLADVLAETPEHTPAVGEPRLRVGLVTGCVQRAFFGDVNRATARVLSADGCDVVAPRKQGCCGALALHAGEAADARRFARALIQAFDASGVDQVVVNAAGCGSAMKEYGHLLKDDPQWADRARAFAARVRDVSEVLAGLDPPRAARRPMHLRVAYHDACHLAHAQGVRREPRQVLASIPGVTIVPIAESELCCGSAGIFNLVQPEMAAELGRRKAARVADAVPDVVVTSNPGCILQLRAAARARGDTYPVIHIVELLDRATARPLVQ